MSVQVVPIPAGSSVAVVEDNDRRNRGDERSRHPDHYDITNAVTDARRDLFGSITDTRYDLQTAVTDSRRDVSEKVTESRFALAKEIDAECDEVSDDVSHVGASMQDRFLAMQKQLSDTNVHTLLGFKDSMALAYQVEGRAALDAAKNAASLQVQIDKNFAATQVQSDKNAATLAAQADRITAATQLQASTNFSAASIEATKFADAASLEAVKNASASVLLAQQLAAAAAAQAAECCCALKEKIKADGDMTRALINSIEHDRLRERAAKAEQMLAAYYSAGKTPVVP